MNVTIYPSHIKGAIAAPPSKSVTHRAILLAGLADGSSTIKNCLIADDTTYTINACRALGVGVEQNGTTLTVKGTNGLLTAPKEPIFVGNSGSTIRMVSGLAAIAKGKTVLTGEKRLQERPMDDLLTALSDLGVKASSVKNNGCPPVAITGETLRGGTVKVSGYTSSQYITSLLLIAPFAEDGLVIIAQNLRSKPYVALTIDLIQTFGVNVENKNFEEFRVEKGQGYKAQQYKVEGDYSSASYFFAAAAVTGSTITVKSLNPKSKQGDAHFLTILQQMGCQVKRRQDAITLISPIPQIPLKPVTADMGDYPDAVQTLTAVAAYAKGITRITNISHLKGKETDRIQKPAEELLKMGIKSNVTDNEMIIHGGKPKGATIQTHGDHRMAMSFAVAALAADGKTVIEHAEVVNKSYPGFWDDLKSIGVKLDKNKE